MGSMYFLRDLITGPIGIFVACFWILMLVDCVQRREQQWLWILIFLGPIGALAYFISVRPAIIPAQLIAVLTGKPTTAGQIKEIKAKIRRSPDSFLYLSLGRLYIDAKKAEEAVKALEKSLELDKENPAAHLFLGKAFVELKKYRESIPHLEVALKTKERDHLVQAYRLIGESLEKLGEEKKAMNYYDQLIRMYPFSEARYIYGLLLHKHNRPAEARTQMEAIITEAEDLPDFSQKKERAWVGRARRFLAKNK